MKSNSMENMQKQFFCSCGRKNKAIYNKPSAKKMVETCPNPRTYIRGLSQITFALRVGRWSEKRVVYYIKSAN